MDAFDRTAKGSKQKRRTSGRRAQRSRPHAKSSHDEARPFGGLVHILFVLLCGIAWLMPAEIQAQLSPAQERAIDSVFAPWDADTLPGCVVGVMQEGRLRFARGYGAADLATRTRLKPQTRIGIASLTKQFTAAAIGLLVQDGRLGLDDDVRRFLPELPEYEPPIRIRDLVYHTSGLRDYVGLIGLRGGDPEAFVPKSEILRLIALQRRTNHAPGMMHAYSNTNYYLLGEIIGRVTGVPLPEFAERELFRPLGMRATSFATLGTLLPDRAESYRLIGDTLAEVQMTGALGGDGGIYGSLEDLARWDAHFARPTLSKNPDGFLRLITSNGATRGGEVTGYGWGNQFGEYRGVPTQGHGGTWGGYRVQYLRFPSLQTGLAVLCNQLEISPFQLIRRVADVVLSAQMSNPAPTAAGMAVARAPDAAAPRPTGPVDSATAVRYVGEYWSPELDVLYRVQFDSEGLRLRIGMREPLPVRIAHADTLLLPGVALVMHPSAGGPPAGFTVNTGRVRGVEFQRLGGRPPGVTMPRGRSITLDGRNAPGEWADAMEVPIRVEADWVVHARLKHDGEHLLVGFFGLRSGSIRVPEVMIDARHDGGNVWKADDWWFHASAGDCASAGRFNDYSTCAPEAADWSATNVRGMTFPEVMELRIPMRLVGIAPGQTVGMALNVTDTRTIWNLWPGAAQVAVPSSWARVLIEP